MEKLIEFIDTADRNLFIFLNSLHHPHLDFFMYWMSDRWIWIPFYAVLVIIIASRFKWKSILIVSSIAVTIILADQITSGIMKPLFERYRPCHDPELLAIVHTLNHCGGKFGLASSHAANTFALAMFIWMLFRKYYSWTWLIFLWAAVVSYSRIYLGVHYPGDILLGGITGILAAYLVFHFYEWIHIKWGIRANSQKTF